MKKLILTSILMVFLLVLLSACGKAETPAPTAAVETPLQQATAIPTQAPVEPTTPAAEPQTDAPGLQQPPPVAPTIDGRELLESRCATCHALSRTTNATGTLEEWDAIVTRMIAKGANLTPEEKAILVQYLAETYKK